MVTGHISTSSAFCEGWSRPELLASVHKSEELRKVKSVDQIYFRTRVFGSDMLEIRQLHAEWLPVDYNEEFYQALSTLDSNVLSVMACIKGTNLIVAMATVAIKRREIRYNFSCDLLTHLNLDPDNDSVAYILTLGVVDELRRSGIASALLEETTKRISRSDPDCRVVFLHVIDYNEPAMNLYRKHGFVEFKNEPNFYRIAEVWYSGTLFYKRLKKSTGNWLPDWVQRITMTNKNL